MSSLLIVDRGRVEAALPRYELGAELGRGAFGLVLSARHRGLGREDAVKVLTASVHEVGAGSGPAERFAAEAQILATLDHPHVMRVYDYVEHHDLRLIIMELLPGGTLRSRAASGVSVERACAAGLAVAEALACAHGRGVLHRDIKPDNTLFSADGLLKVGDFGIAKIFDDSAASRSALSGTPHYMAPEQFTGGRLSPPTDLYALGVVLYELLSRRMIFGSGLSPMALMHHHIELAPQPLDEAPSPIAAVIMRTLEKDAGERPQSARAFAADLAAAAVQALGPGWLADAGMPLHLDGGIRDIANGTTTVRRPRAEQAAPGPVPLLPLADQALDAETAPGPGMPAHGPGHGAEPGRREGPGSDDDSVPATSTPPPGAELEPRPAGLAVPNGDPPTPPGAQQVPSPGTRRRAAWAALAAVGVLLVAALLVWQVAGPGIFGEDGATAAPGGAGALANVARTEDPGAAASKPGESPSGAPRRGGAPESGPSQSGMPAASASPDGAGSPPSTPGSGSSPPAQRPAEPEPPPAAPPQNPAPPPNEVPQPVRPALLGAPDWDGHCRATGQGTAMLIGSNAYSWRCSTPSAVGNDGDAVCDWTYGPNPTTNVIGDFYDPYSWECWRATRRLGPIDFSAYCRALGYPGAIYIDGRNAYGYYCSDTTGPRVINAADACLRLYGSSPPIARFQNFYNKDSWECWG